MGRGRLRSTRAEGQEIGWADCYLGLVY
eukprot:COSAG01_NODE_34956_length_539_cov_1.052273_1_plen_27_part_10